MNIYKDKHSGGWYLEILCADGDWHLYNVYGTRSAALAAAKALR